MQLRFLHVSGPKRRSGDGRFRSGLNVINGPSNTGKSHILRLIDYVLGAQDAPEPIAEQALYDLVHLGVAMDDGSEKTFVRALQGGEIRIIDGLIKARPEPKQGIAVSARHGRSSLSKILLEQLGAAGTRIQTRAAGDTAISVIRDLDNYALITKPRSRTRTSPVLSGQYILEAGRDVRLQICPDRCRRFRRSIWPSPRRRSLCVRPRNSNCSIKQIRELDQEIAAADHDQEELEKLDSSLDAELAESFQVQEEAESDYRDLTAAAGGCGVIRGYPGSYR